MKYSMIKSIWSYVQSHKLKNLIVGGERQIIEEYIK